MRRCLVMLACFNDARAESETMSGDGEDTNGGGSHLPRVVIKCVDVMASGTASSLSLKLERWVPKDIS